MYYCNTCDKEFSRKDNLVRHHRKFHDNEDSLKYLLQSLEDENMPGPSRKRPREDSTDEDLESDEGNVSSASSSEDEIEDQLNDEDESTPSIYELKNVWEILNEEADRVYEGDVVKAYIDQVRVGRRLKSDPVHKKVMETMQRLQKRDNNMDFNEALIKAAHRRKHIIEQAAEEAVEDAALIAKEAQGST